MTHSKAGSKHPHTSMFSCLAAITALAGISLVSGPANAQANDCMANAQVPYAMLEIQQMAFPDIDHLKRPGWYSTSSQAQADAVFDALDDHQHKLRSLIDITHFHILNMPNASLVLYGDSKSTCGFLGVIAIEGQTARYAIAQANATFEREQSSPLPYAAANLEDIQAQMRERFAAVMYLIDYGQGTPDAKKFCEKLIFDNEIGVIPELEELEVNETFRGQAARYLPNEVRIRTKATERFLSNAVGYDNAKRFWRMDGFILLEYADATDILVIVGDNLCGLNSAISVPNDIIQTLLDTPHEPSRSTQPGDPIVNMTEEERRAWQSIQGVLQGQNPVEGFGRLLSGE